jgi:hypothetical protein
MVFYQVFLLSPLHVQNLNCRNCKRLREFEEIKVSRQKSCTCRVECELQGGKLLRLLSVFRPRIRPLDALSKRAAPNQAARQRKWQSMLNLCRRSLVKLTVYCPQQNHFTVHSFNI